MRVFNARILALALILVFTQKMGLGIWMHNWLHETKVLKGQSLPAVDKLKATCHCIDDFLVPLVETRTIVAPVPVRVFPVLSSVYCCSFPTISPFLSSLRGPPIVATLS